MQRKRVTVEVESLGSFPLTYSELADPEHRRADNITVGLPTLESWLGTYGLALGLERLLGRQLTQGETVRALARLIAAAMTGQDDPADLAAAIVEAWNRRHGLAGELRKVSLGIIGGLRPVRVALNPVEEPCAAANPSQPALND